jgi:acyl carrier protein
MQDIIEDIRTYIVEKYLPGEDPKALTPTTPLISSGILNSLATLDLVAFLEKRYGVEFESHDLDQGRLGTLTTIAELVQSKKKAART